MSITQTSLAAQLAARSRIGYSLDQAFYCDDQVFAADMEHVVSRKWLVAGHIDQIRSKGDYFLYQIGNESIIVVRQDETTVNAFFNVCRHRGSVLCTESAGKVARFTCPYHAWTYTLDGKLIAARLMPADFSKDANHLHRCHVRVLHGFVFINLSTDTPDDFDATFGDLHRYLDFHGFADAKIAHRESYPTTANWKLVVENFFECYHCTPTHPEFCSMHPSEALMAYGAGPTSGPAAQAMAKYQPILEAWQQHAASLGRPIGDIDDAPGSSHLRVLLQRGIRNGFDSETQDGRPAAPLMGKRRECDQGRMYISFSPFSQLIACNDFAVLFQFSPRSTRHTDVEVMWLVDGKATEYDVPRMIWGWDTTTRQDKTITENNQLGVLSTRYQPGRYSDQEQRVETFQKWYLAQLGRERT